ncbi:MAG: SAM-dependent methyltransferase [Flavobacteriales bacterium]|jgi:16S rRNA (cytidine1402-2'-O)-methyltransferase|nr:SAM-dependent methyltransferase [Flavobacteriales bacterium]
MKGTVYMLPMTLGDSSIESVIPQEVQERIKTLKYFIVENIKTTRRYLKKIDQSIDIDELTFFELNKHTDHSEIADFIVPALNGNDIGMISEAGCPGIADPGSEIARIAHLKGIVVKPLVGPSSILMALISSGMNGQEFSFNGYLPFDKSKRSKKIKDLERLAQRNFTQLFMETPFRNNALLEEVLKNCNGGLKLCIAADISLETEFIKTKTIAEWKKNIPNLKKRPVMFVLGK